MLFCYLQDKPPIKETYRFEKNWPRVPSFMEVVQEAWHEEVPRISPLNILFLKFQ
jgi:hypothetical protein